MVVGQKFKRYIPSSELKTSTKSGEYELSDNWFSLSLQNPRMDGHQSHYKQEAEPFWAYYRGESSSATSFKQWLITWRRVACLWFYWPLENRQQCQLAFSSINWWKAESNGYVDRAKEESRLGLSCYSIIHVFMISVTFASLGRVYQLNLLMKSKRVKEGISAIDAITKMTIN